MTKTGRVSHADETIREDKEHSLGSCQSGSSYIKEHNNNTSSWKLEPRSTNIIPRQAAFQTKATTGKCWERKLIGRVKRESQSSEVGWGWVLKYHYKSCQRNLAHFLAICKTDVSPPLVPLVLLCACFCNRTWLTNGHLATWDCLKSDRWIPAQAMKIPDFCVNWCVVINREFCEWKVNYDLEWATWSTCWGNST